MNLTRCARGHFYDLEKYNSCPHCGEDMRASIHNIDRSDRQSNKVKNRVNSNVGKKICLNLVKWVIQTVLFSLVPLVFFMLIHWMFQINEPSLDKDIISQLCPFTLVISSSIAMELAKEKYMNTNIKEVIFPVYLVLLILFFMLYGATEVSFQLEIPLQENILKNIFDAVLLISIIHLVIGVLLQILGGFYDE